VGINNLFYSTMICHLVAIVGTGTALKEYGVGEA